MYTVAPETARPTHKGNPMTTTLSLFAAQNISVLILSAIERLQGEFTVSQLEHSCPGVSRDMIRLVLREQQKVDAVECQGRGPAARWKKKG